MPKVSQERVEEEFDADRYKFFKTPFLNGMVEIFNPRVKEYLEQNPEVRMLRFWWAQVWRFYLIMSLISTIIVLFLEMG